MHPLRSLSPSERAAFAVSSRLLSCLVTESLLKAIFVPSNSNTTTEICGTCVILSRKASKSDVPVGRPYHPSDIFLLVSLHSPPVVKPSVGPTKASEVGLVDPSDMLPWIYEIREEPNPHQSKVSPKVASSQKSFSFKKLTRWQAEHLTQFASSLPTEFYNATQHTITSLSLDPLNIWSKLCMEIELDDANRISISEELESSMGWQSMCECIAFQSRFDQ